MPLICSICTISLEQAPVDDQNEIQNINYKPCAAPCGHIFHVNCIDKWMLGGIPTSDKCPCCRKPMANKCIPLFLDSYEEEPVTQALVVECNHESEIKNLKSKVSRLSSELDDQKRLFILQGNDYKNLNELYEHEKRVSQSYAEENSRSEKYEKKYDEVCQKLIELKKIIKEYESGNSVDEMDAVSESKDMSESVETNQDIGETLDAIQKLFQSQLKRNKQNEEIKNKEITKYKSIIMQKDLKMKALQHMSIEQNIEKCSIRNLKRKKL